MINLSLKHASVECLTSSICCRISASEIGDIWGEGGSYTDRCGECGEGKGEGVKFCAGEREIGDVKDGD